MTIKTITNEDRACRAAGVLDIYAQRHGEDTGGEDVFRDLLADMMHYADLYGLRFERELSAAEHNYEAEVAEEA